ncbi:sulfotransferase [Pseudoalteromonas sp. MMG012]|uniref:sulfotransferase family protein n=1 Tax=Pseudoalteromonas sp. MMG012 TaxID=2822686 RepID=UPI001B39E862|nr:sulfotransferase [Pseudoalteromonas sp. MMG012]MBQ4849230.1 sulfotransferase [Pseudoalteromonas sp. MMG012]
MNNNTAPLIESFTAPDFVIAGAMKCGTTTLHQMLAQHPGIFMANDELFYFDMDDIAQHPDFLFKEHERLLTHDQARDPKHYQSWYESRFKEASEGQLRGEDSTTYMCSELAVARLAKLKPEMKLVIMLRQPSKRVYSHYWHMVRAGRAIYSFEDTLRFQPSLLLQRSDYCNQLKIIYRYFAHEQVKVILFEDLVKNADSVIRDVCVFLGVSEDKLPSDVSTIHANKGQVPMFFRLHLLKCRLFREGSSKAYQTHFTDAKIKNSRPWYEKIYRKLNPMINKKAPQIRPDHKELLDSYFSKTMIDINELTGQRVFETWFSKED